MDWQSGGRGSGRGARRLAWCVRRSRRRTDAGSRAFDAWPYARGVKLEYIQPGKPVQNAFMDNFNGSFRDECLNLHWFQSLADAKRVIENWREDYNSVRPA
jgi:transposase InsO family protein